MAVMSFIEYFMRASVWEVTPRHPKIATCKWYLAVDACCGVSFVAQRICELYGGYCSDVTHFLLQRLTCLMEMFKCGLVYKLYKDEWCD